MYAMRIHTSQRRPIRPALARSVGSCLLAILVVGVGGFNASPAQASPGGLMVSPDGVTYASGNTLPLFQNMGKVIPGDERVETIWVRNEAATAGRLRIDLVNPSSDDAHLAEDISLSVAEEGGVALGSVTIAHGMKNGSCTVLSNEFLLQPGESTKLSVTAVVDALLSEREGSGGAVSFQLRGVLEEAVAVPSSDRSGVSCGAATPDPIDKPDPDPTDQTDPNALEKLDSRPADKLDSRPAAMLDPRLAATGNSAPIVAITLGMLAIGGGVLFGLLSWRRRTATPKHDDTTEVSSTEQP